MKQQNGMRIFITFLVLILSVITLLPTWQVWSVPMDSDKPIKEQARRKFIIENPTVAKKAINLGLDLAGGTHLVVEVDTSKLTEEQIDGVVDRCLEIIRNRVDKFGVSEPVINKTKKNRIVAELAGVDAEKAKQLIGKTAELQFKLLAEDSEFGNVITDIENYLNERTGMSSGSEGNTDVVGQDIFGSLVKDDTLPATGDTSKTEEKESALELMEKGLRSYFIEMPSSRVGVKLEDIPKVEQLLAIPNVKALIPKKFEFLWGRNADELNGGGFGKELYLLKRRKLMTGKHISDARPGRDQNGKIEVSLTFDGKGALEFKHITGNNIGKPLAIILDSVVYSAPVIQTQISQGRASITGIGEYGEAELLSTSLKAGALPTPMNIVELRSVGATLGKKNIDQGLKATIVGFVLVILFMFFYYTGSGIIANIALVFNLLIIGAILSLFHATLTLPGIAGVILTIGMAVDANVIIFERIKEELRAGRPVRGAIDAGYKRAFTTIFDSNITTFGTALILYNLGTGPIRGFGLTLMVGIGSSMFTALYVTRLVFNLKTNKVDIKNLSIGRGIKALINPTYSFLSKAKSFSAISVLIIVLSFGGLAVLGPNFGIDFVGGNVYQVKFESAPDIQKIKDGLVTAGLTGSKVKKIGTAKENEVLISTEKAQDDSATTAQVNQAIGSAKIIGQETVGPTIGKDLMWGAIWSFLTALVLIIIYIWVRFGRHGLGFGLGAVVALTHDALITSGIYGLLSVAGISGLEYSLTFVAAILTIVGYSLNDTIVVFDRIRENLELSGKEGLPLKFNKAINQSLARTIVTSLTTFIVVLIMAIAGGAAIKGFAIAMIVGVMVGTYSSVFIASPFVLWYSQRRAGGIKIKKRNT